MSSSQRRNKSVAVKRNYEACYILYIFQSKEEQECSSEA